MFFCDREHALVRTRNPDGPGFAERTFGERVANGPHAATRLGPRFEHERLASRLPKNTRGIETGQSGAHDDDIVIHNVNSP